MLAVAGYVVNTEHPRWQGSVELTSSPLSLRPITEELEFRCRAYSAETGQPFQRKLDTESAANWTAAPVETDSRSEAKHGAMRVSGNAGAPIFSLGQFARLRSNPFLPAILDRIDAAMKADVP
jgi:hypothetical protein